MFCLQALLSNISKKHISFYLTNIILFSLPSQTLSNQHLTKLQSQQKRQSVHGHKHIGISNSETSFFIVAASSTRRARSELRQHVAIRLQCSHVLPSTMLRGSNASTTTLAMARFTADCMRHRVGFNKGCFFFFVALQVVLSVLLFRDPATNPSVAADTIAGHRQTTGVVRVHRRAGHQRLSVPNNSGPNVVTGNCGTLLSVNA